VPGLFLKIKLQEQNTADDLFLAGVSQQLDGDGNAASAIDGWTLPNGASVGG